MGVRFPRRNWWNGLLGEIPELAAATGGCIRGASRRHWAQPWPIGRFSRCQMTVGLNLAPCGRKHGCSWPLKLARGHSILSAYSDSDMLYGLIDGHTPASLMRVYAAFVQ